MNTTCYFILVTLFLSIISLLYGLTIYLKDLFFLIYKFIKFLKTVFTSKSKKNIKVNVLNKITIEIPCENTNF